MSEPATTRTAAARLPLRGYLLHLTHYDPVWVARKSQEQPFELDLALQIVDTLAARGFNTLLVGVSDGVVFASHPELRRPYSQPIAQLAQLCAHARQKGLEIIPKLNFSKSEVNCHDHWSRAPGEPWHTHFDDDVYFQRGFDVIDEIIAACKPARYFHVGMDEDHERSHAQYVRAILRLREGLAARHLRTVCWSDSAIDYSSGDVYREKTAFAETQLPTDCVRLLWNYWNVPAGVMQTIRHAGYELWGAPGGKLEQATAFRDALLAAGGTGLVMTHWIACRHENQAALLARITDLAGVYQT